MIISIDYDGTFTADTGRWKAFIRMMSEVGHTFVCVTSRAGTEENKKILGDHIGVLMPIIFCNHQPKARVCKSLGYKIDVWIDDRPQTIPVSARVDKHLQQPNKMNEPVYFHNR